MYTPIYYQTIADTGIDPVTCSDFSAWPLATGSGPPVQLAEKALAKASGAPARVPRKRAPRKATGAGAGATASTPAMAAPKTARGTAKVAASG